MTIDQDKLTDFLHKFVGDLGATMAAGNVLVGDRLGFYRALAGHPMLPYELAEHTGTAARSAEKSFPERSVVSPVQHAGQVTGLTLPSPASRLSRVLRRAGQAEDCSVYRGGSGLRG